MPAGAGALAAQRTAPLAFPSMRLPRFPFRRRELAPTPAQDEAGRLLAESLRTLADVAARLAEFVEAERLRRKGYERPGRTLERLDEPPRR